MNNSPGTEALGPLSVITPFLDQSGRIHLFILAKDGTVLGGNESAADLLGIPRTALSGRNLRSSLPHSHAERLTGLLGGTERASGTLTLRVLDVGGLGHQLRCQVVASGEEFLLLGEETDASIRELQEKLLETNGELSVLARESARQSRALARSKVELEEALEELRTSYWHLEKIQEVLPICMRCGKVRTAESGWEDVAEYFRANQLTLSHGYCPHCTSELRTEWGLPPEDPEEQ